MDYIFLKDRNLFCPNFKVFKELNPSVYDEGIYYIKLLDKSNVYNCFKFLMPSNFLILL